MPAARRPHARSPKESRGSTRSIPSPSPSAAVAAEAEEFEGEEPARAGRARDSEPRSREGPPVVPDRDPSQLTPQGKRRSGVTESEGLRYRLPDPKLLRTSGKGQGPDTSNQDEIARLLVESLGHFGVEAKIVGRVTGPRVTATSCGSRPAPRSRRSRS